MTFEILVLIILIINSIVFISSIVVDNDAMESAGCLSAIMACFILLSVVLFIDERPEAIDVYRGKTTLEITYQDSVAIDSVVVFKDKSNEYDD